MVNVGFTYLLLIAIDNYEADFPNLQNCINDAKAIKDIFVSKYGVFEKNVTELYNESATRKSILKTIKKYKTTLTDQDNLIILFSGHGRIIGKKGYWAPYDAEIPSEFDDISNSMLKEYLDDLKVRHLLLIVDACFSGSIFANTKSINFRGDIEEEDFNSERASRWGISASHSRERAFDGSPGDNSPFAKNFISCLKENKKPERVQRLLAKVIDKVKQSTNDMQEPICRPLNVKGDELGSFILKPTISLEVKFQQLLSANSIVLKKQIADSIYEDLLNKEEVPREHLFYFATIVNKLRTGFYTKEEITKYLINTESNTSNGYNNSTINLLRLLENNRLLRLQVLLKRNPLLRKYLKIDTKTLINNYNNFNSTIFESRESKVVIYNRMTEQWTPFISAISYFSNFSKRIQESLLYLANADIEKSIKTLMNTLIERPLFFHFYIIQLAGIKREHEKIISAGYKINSYENNDHFDRLNNINIKLATLINTIEEEHPQLFHLSDLELLQIEDPDDIESIKLAIRTHRQKTHPPISSPL